MPDKMVIARDFVFRAMINTTTDASREILLRFKLSEFSRTNISEKINAPKIVVGTNLSQSSNHFGSL